MKVRLKFSKTGTLKFIGHLDLMRTFQKIFRQAELPIAYSEGFNPHQIFSIAAPLAVGVTSSGEYLDMKLVQNMDTQMIIDHVNACCPNGLKIEAAIVIDDHEPSAMASVSAAKYSVLQEECVLTEENIANFALQDSIVIKKKNKKGKINDFDIKPGIYNIVINDNKIIMTLATGSTLNVKPDAVFSSLSEFIGASYDPFNYKVHREELYHSDSAFIPLSVPVEPVF
ncbi:MAG: Fe-S oxidoreductase [Firmicutes bacterium HGW-Firmicutes-1]|jgi:radical SAM-linked protein|nr:MAG: Fe-S oxidoreductase [Firmicutes bacterium HGW-Firmicutes-1]